MDRELTEREAAVLRAMIASGTGESAVTDVDRARWASQLPTLRVVGMCGCGMCPSIELSCAGRLVVTADSSGGATAERVLIEAWVQDASVLLFVDDDRPSYLELAPLRDDRPPFTVFPPAAELRF